MYLRTICIFFSVIAGFIGSRFIATNGMLGLITNQEGEFWILKSDKTLSKVSNRGTIIRLGETIRTGVNATIDLKYIDDASFMRLSEKTEITLSKKKEAAVFQKESLLKTGKIWIESKSQTVPARILTPAGMLSYSAANFYATVNASNDCKIWVLDGNVHLRNKKGEIMIPNGCTGELNAGFVPKKIDKLTSDMPGFGRDNRRELKIPFKNEKGEEIKLIITFIKK